MEQATSAFGVPGEKSGRPGFRRDGARSLRGLCRHGGHRHGHPLEDPGIVMLGIQGAGVLFFFFLKNLGMGKAGNFSTSVAVRRLL